MAEYKKPLPVIDEDNAPYWEYCKNHELRMQKCKQCGHIRFPPGIVCPKCHSMEYDWTKMSGKGKIFTWVVFQKAFHEAYKEEIPYAVAIIKLEEGPKMESNITGIGPHEIKMDMPVELYFDDVCPGWALPKFKVVKK
jgi:uncharacterized protein